MGGTQKACVSAEDRSAERSLYDSCTPHEQRGTLPKP